MPALRHAWDERSNEQCRKEGNMKLCMGCMEQMEDQLTICPHCGYDETSAVQEAYYLIPGTVIGGKYIVGKALKYGGYTVKYIGMDAENNRKVMIAEYLPNEFSTRSEGEEQVTIYSGDAMEQFGQGLITFLNEGNRICQLGSVSGIASVYDCVAQNDTGYIISEYLEGHTLQEVLDEGVTYQPNEAVQLICTILRGLEQVHPMNIIHCDIAPETIMLTKDGQVKLLDFGATRYVTTANSKSLAIILKQGYAPEEQYRSQGQRGPWTDVYALGAVLYRLLTGKVPEESVERALDDELQEPSKLGVSLPISVENALMNALNVYQKDRTSSASVFLKELTGNDTKRIKVKQHKRETGKLPIWAKGLVAVVICAVVAGGIVIVQQSRKDNKSKVVTQKETKFSTGVNGSFAAFEKQWKSYGFNMDHVQKEYCYDASVTEDMVKEFEDLTNGSLTEGAQVPDSEPKTENKMIAKIVIASKDKVTFQQDWVENCYQTKADTTYDKKGYPNVPEDAGDASKAYGTIKTVLYDGKEYGEKSLEKLPNPLNINGLRVKIYTGSYYSLPADKSKKEAWYLGQNVKNLRFYYGTKDYKGKKQVLSTAYYKQDYISFTKAEGTITEVASESLKAGKKYSGKRESGVLFHVVGKKLALGNITVAQLEKECRDYGIHLKKNGHGNDEIISKVDANTCQTGKTLVVLQAAPKVVVTPAPAPTKADSTPIPRTDNKRSMPKRNNTTNNNNTDGNNFGN